MKILEAEGGSHFDDFAKRASAAAKRSKRRRRAEWHGIVFWIKPGDNANAVMERYYRALQRFDKQRLKSQKRKRRR